MTPKILGSAEISTARSVFLKFWSCGSKIFKNDPNFKMVKNHHFSTFDDFFFLLEESTPSWPHLPNFASQKFLPTLRTPLENWKNHQNWLLLKSLKWQKFLSKSEISVKKSKFQHIAPSYFPLSLFYAKLMKLCKF